MQTLKDLKDRLVVGAELTLVDTNKRPHAALGLSRKIQKRTATAIQFEPIPGKESGSWLDIPKRSEVTLGTNSFTIKGDFSVLSYQFTGASAK